MNKQIAAYYLRLNNSIKQPIIRQKKKKKKKKTRELLLLKRVI